MSKELEALENLYHNIGNSTENYLIVKTALKDYEKQDNIINIIKETIEFSIQEPEMEIKENGEISLLSRVGMILRKQLNEKERKLFREWVLKECFPEELKALEIIKEIIPIEEEDFYFDEETNKYFFIGYEVKKEKYDLLKEVLL